MRLPILILLIFIVINICIDTYIYNVIKNRFCRSKSAKAYLIISSLLFVLIIVTACIPKSNCSDGMLKAIMWMLFTYIAFYIPRYIYLIFDLLAKIPVLFKHKRIKCLSWLGMFASLFVFILLWWGALIDRNKIEVKEVAIEIENLPADFEGYKIVQFSDLHTGTFGCDTAFVAKLVDRINGLNPDLIVFTGDIVNSKTSELIPHLHPLSRLSASDGVYSILGNHDYGDYSRWTSDKAKSDNLRQLKSLQREMGWNLLLNESEFIHRGNNSIALIGVENIGDPPFKIYGSLTKAYPALSDSITKILLTHNPMHWSDSISSNDNVNIALSLSGHTHAMQIELFGWSPAKYRYPTWGGLYADRDEKHKLYVNIGSGTVGFPARIGATPEITLIELKRK